MHVHMEPQLKEMSSDIGERAGIAVNHLKILLYHPPAWWLLCCEDCWIKQATLWNRREKHSTLLRSCAQVLDSQ